MAICSFNLVTVKLARVNAVLTALGSNALATFYTGPPPFDASVAATGTQLAQLACSATFGTVTAGTSGTTNPKLTANAITSGTGAATGVPGYCRLSTSAGVGVVDLDCGAAGSGASVIVTPDSITSGVTVAISSIVITEG
jgi:hypothetical protein